MLRKTDLIVLISLLIHALTLRILLRFDLKLTQFGVDVARLQENPKTGCFGPLTGIKLLFGSGAKLVPLRLW
jgi:hypothetical protein